MNWRSVGGSDGFIRRREKLFGILRFAAELCFLLGGEEFCWSETPPIALPHKFFGQDASCVTSQSPNSILTANQAFYPKKLQHSAPANSTFGHHQIQQRDASFPGLSFLCHYHNFCCLPSHRSNAVVGSYWSLGTPQISPLNDASHFRPNSYSAAPFQRIGSETPCSALDLDSLAERLNA